MTDVKQINRLWGLTQFDVVFLNDWDRMVGAAEVRHIALRYHTLWPGKVYYYTT